MEGEAEVPAPRLEVRRGACMVVQRSWLFVRRLDKAVERSEGRDRHPTACGRCVWTLRHTNVFHCDDLRRRRASRDRVFPSLGCDHCRANRRGRTHLGEDRWDGRGGCVRRSDVRKENENGVWSAHVHGFCRRRTRYHAYWYEIDDEMRRRVGGSPRDHCILPLRGAIVDRGCRISKQPSFDVLRMKVRRKLSCRRPSAQRQRFLTYKSLEKLVNCYVVTFWKNPQKISS